MLPARSGLLSPPVFHRLSHHPLPRPLIPHSQPCVSPATCHLPVPQPRAARAARPAETLPPGPRSKNKYCCQKQPPRAPLPPSLGRKHRRETGRQCAGGRCPPLGAALASLGGQRAAGSRAAPRDPRELNAIEHVSSLSRLLSEQREVSKAGIFTDRGFFPRRLFLRRLPLQELPQLAVRELRPRGGGGSDPARCDFPSDAPAAARLPLPRHGFLSRCRSMAAPGRHRR